jgi:glutamate-ammonia-ligase adenylyltransferase
VRSAAEYLEQLNRSGAMAERLGLLQGRTVAGNAVLSEGFVAAIQAFLLVRDPDRQAIAALLRGERNSDGAHQVETIARLLQLRYGAEYPAIGRMGTLATLEALQGAGLLSETIKRELAQAYVFLRTVEHRRQLVDDANFTGLGSADDVAKQVSACCTRVRALSLLLADQLEN